MKNIMVIEDNPDNMALMVEILEDEGFHVMQAEAAEAGIAQLGETGADLILMDISLPQMSGLEAIRIIRSDSVICTIPVIALTAHAMAADRDQALAAGCNDFHTKPINEDKLLASIRELLK